MSRPLIQIDDEVREMNDEEFAASEASREAAEAAEAARLAEEAEKAAHRAQILQRLGLTEDEAKLLLS
jgi:hypothetical protein